MTDRWARIKELFREIQQRDPSTREAWLAEQCAGNAVLHEEVRRLLAAQRAAPGILERDAAGVLHALSDVEARADRVGDRIGPYRLLRLLGEGGMGSVYLAERADGDFAQRVALKLVRADFVSADLRARFLRERDFLARLTHPHIAQLHDGGVAADGTPYFTLEYVEGKPITRYCDERRWDVRQRIALMLQVCAAIAYAHRNLIVHRDLKPSNILVTSDDEAKLLDFGIAKLLDSENDTRATVTQARMMTPEYAAPEQVLGESITTATDVYTIGVLLYELLSGRLPYARADAGAVSWSKAVVEESAEPVYRALSRTAGAGDASNTAEVIATARGTTLPALRRALRGDLDRIVQRALAKEPEARYPSVVAMADDLRAYADGRAISGGSRTYRLRKFARRHWLPLAASAAVATVLVASGAAVVWQAHQAEREARTTLAVKDFLFGLFAAVDPREAKGRDITAHELLDRGAERIGRSAALEPTERAEIEATLGRIYYQIGLFEQANRLQESALAGMRDDASKALLYAQTEGERASTVNELGDAKAAALLADDALARMDALPSASAYDRAHVLHARTRISLVERDFLAAQRDAARELTLARAAGSDTRALFDAYQSAGGASWGLGDAVTAENYYRQALEVATSETAPDEFGAANVRINLAMALQNQSRYADAEAVDSLALASLQRLVAADHPLMLTVERDLGLAYLHQGRYGQARAQFEQVLRAQRARLGDQHPSVAGTEINLGLAMIESGDIDAADRTLADAVAIFDKKFGRDYQGTRAAGGDLAVVHMLEGKLESAQAELEAIEKVEDAVGANEQDNYTTRWRIGEVKRRRGDFVGAIEIERAALALARKAHPERTRFVANAHHYLGLSLRDAGDIAGAESELRAALASYAGYIPGAAHPLAATTRYELGMLLSHRGDRAEAVRLLTEAAELRERFLGADDPRTKQARDALQSVQRVATL